MKYAEPGPKLDALVRKALAEPLPIQWNPSTSRSDVTFLIDRLAPWVGNYETSDGYFVIKYAAYAGHNNESKDCCPDWKWYTDRPDDDVDPLPWSCHIHLGAIGANAGCPGHWKHGQTFCARGRTMPHAICLAFLKAMQKAKKPMAMYQQKEAPGPIRKLKTK